MLLGAVKFKSWNTWDTVQGFLKVMEGCLMAIIVFLFRLYRIKVFSASTTDKKNIYNFVGEKTNLDIVMTNCVCLKWFVFSMPINYY